MTSLVMGMEQGASAIEQGGTGMEKSVSAIEPSVPAFEPRRSAKKEGASAREPRRSPFEERRSGSRESAAAFWTRRFCRSKRDFASRTSDAAKTHSRSSTPRGHSGSGESVASIETSDVPEMAGDVSPSPSDVAGWPRRSGSCAGTHRRRRGPMRVKRGPLVRHRLPSSVNPGPRPDSG